MRGVPTSAISVEALKRPAAATTAPCRIVRHPGSKAAEILRLWRLSVSSLKKGKRKRCVPGKPATGPSLVYVEDDATITPVPTSLHSPNEMEDHVGWLTDVGHCLYTVEVRIHEHAAIRKGDGKPWEDVASDVNRGAAGIERRVTTKVLHDSDGESFVRAVTRMDGDVVLSGLDAAEPADNDFHDGSDVVDDDGHVWSGGALRAGKMKFEVDGRGLGTGLEAIEEEVEVVVALRRGVGNEVEGRWMV